MKNTTCPVAYNFLVKAHVSLLRRSNQPALTLFVRKVCLFIEETLPSKYRPVHVYDLLQHFLIIIANLLVLKLSAVQVVFHKFFDSAELDVLVQQLMSAKSLVHKFEKVILHIGVLICCLLKGGQRLEMPH